MKWLDNWIESYLDKKNMAVVPKRNLVTYDGAMERLKRRNVPISTIFDVGASNGSWTREMFEHYPNAHYHCVEAQTAHEPALKKFSAKHSNVSYVISAAGAEEGKIFFSVTEVFGGVASYDKSGIEVPVTTLDIQAQKRGLKPPYMIKLDTHGFEVPILDGCAKILEQTEVVIVEVYNIKGNPPMLSFFEFCQYMDRKGFQCMDLYDPLFRPHDEALWQMDFIFMKKSRPEFGYTYFY